MADIVTDTSLEEDKSEVEIPSFAQTLSVRLPYIALPYQKDLGKDSHRFVTVVASRRVGKSIYAINKLLKWAVMRDVPENTPFYYIAPYYHQAKTIAWNLLLRYVPRELWARKPNETSLTMYLVNGRTIVLKGADNALCYDEQTEILTDNGWKYFKDLQNTEKVLTLNQEGYAEWKLPHKYINQPYEGDMYEVKSKKLDLLVTPNHRFYIESGKGKKKFKTLDKIANHDRIPASVKFKGQGTISDAMCAIVGFYLAEGTAKGNSGGHIHNGNYEVLFAQTEGIKGGNKGNVREDFIKILEQAGYYPQPRYQYKDGKKALSDGVFVLSKVLHRHLLPLGNKYTKFIPKAYKELSPEKLRILIHWMIMGDGSSRGVTGKTGSDRTYLTVSKQLADDLQEIAIKAGYSATIRQLMPSDVTMKDGRKILAVNCKLIYKVSLFVNAYNYFMDSKEKYIKKTTYKGNVYCVSVDNHVVMVRRNGRICWSGNSLEGTALGGLVVDEISLMSNWNQLWNYTLRPMLADYQSPAVFISKPRGFNHFHDLAKMGDHNHIIEGEASKGIILDKDFITYRFETEINCKQHNGGYIEHTEIEAAKRTLPPEAFDQEWRAKFTKYTGLIHKDFDRLVHIIPNMELPREWLRWRGWDFGSNHPTATLRIAIDPDDNWYVERCLKERDIVIKDFADSVKQEDLLWLNTDGADTVPGFGDPSGKQWIKEFNREKLSIRRAVRTENTSEKNWLQLGIDKINEKLKPRLGHTVFLPDYANTKMENAPSLFILDRPENYRLVSEFETLAYRETQDGINKAEINDTNDKDGHYDLDAAFRYIVVSINKKLAFATLSQPSESAEHAMNQLYLQKTQPLYTPSTTNYYNQDTLEELNRKADLEAIEQQLRN